VLLVAGLLGLLFDGLYLTIIHGQGAPGITDPSVVFFASLVAAASLASVAASLVHHHYYRLALLAFATVGFAVFVILGVLSIGALFVPSAMICCVAFRRELNRARAMA
jgi:hypothetical protein